MSRRTFAADDLPQNAETTDGSRGRPFLLLTGDGLSPAEELVLKTLGDVYLTRRQLCALTGLPRNQLAPLLEGLREKGMVARLNTVIESYRCR